MPQCFLIPGQGLNGRRDFNTRGASRFRAIWHNGDRPRFCLSGFCLSDNQQLAVNAHIFKTASEKWRPALSARFFTVRDRIALNDR
jgi:hypothetical protein